MLRKRITSKNIFFFYIYCVGDDDHRDGGWFDRAKPLLIVLQTPDEVLDQAVLYLRLDLCGMYRNNVVQLDFCGIAVSGKFGGSAGVPWNFQFAEYCI